METHAGSYVRSSLWRYIEEVLAETIAQVKVNRFRNVFVGIGFPIEGGYLYLLRSGADPFFEGWMGKGLLPEGAGLVATGMVAGIAFQLWYKSGVPADRNSGRIP